MNAEHREVQVKVNAFVDEGIAPLVAALSHVDGLVTLESCQGSAGGRDAYVHFKMKDWRTLGLFLFDGLLPALTPDLRSATALRIQAYDSDVAHGTISTDPCAILAVAHAIEAVLAPTIGSRIFMTRDTHRDAVA
jgi:hypothetical protein